MSLLKNFANRSINSTCSAMAKAYEELVELGLAGNSVMKLDYINQYTNSEEGYLGFIIPPNPL